MTDRHAATRVRHELRRRLLTVRSAERITPGMMRIALAGDDLAGFVSAGYDDHVKLCLPLAGQDIPVWPAGPEAQPLPDGIVVSPMRDFTPRRYDADRGELLIDFALHEAGPATEWAASARPGSTLGVGGPRGSFVLTDDFDWYILIGDETALPAIGRRLEELRSGVPVIVVATVAGSEEEQVFETETALETRWIYRPLARASDPAPLLDAIRSLSLPAGDGYIWIAGENETVKTLRAHLVEERGHNRSWIKAAGYWRRGSVGFHENHNDA